MFTSVKAEKRRETRCHFEHIFILSCWPRCLHLASLQLKGTVGDVSHRAYHPLRHCLRVPVPVALGLFHCQLVELLWEYLWCVSKLGLKDPDKNSTLQWTRYGRNFSH